MLFRSSAAGTIAGQIDGPAQTLAGQIANLGSKALSRAQIDSLLRGLPKGISKRARTVGSEAQLDEVFQELSRGGTSIRLPHLGPSVKLPDGTVVRRRPGSTSGGPTIDVEFPGGKIVKVHISPWP